MTTRDSMIISCCNLSKWYSGVCALENASIDLHLGEIVGLIGDNGAGKSTFIKILSGVEQPDTGQIFIDGKQVKIKSPRQAMNRGIETIYQYNSTVPAMSIARNLFIGREPLKYAFGRFGIIDHKRMKNDALEALRDVDLHMRSADAALDELSGGQRQGVAIARAMYFKSRVLILDEPTNHLSVKETDKVISFVKSLKSEGLTGLFVSHNMHQVFETCDRIVIMALGKVVFDGPASQTSIDEVQAYL